MAFRTILLKGANVSIRQEGKAAEAITPGHLIDLNSSGNLVKHANAGQNAQPWFALENGLEGEGITDAYASDDRVQYVRCGRGAEIYALLADGQTVAIGDELESNGDGTLKKHTAPSSGTQYYNRIVAVALEAVTQASSDGNDARIKVVIP